MRARVTSCSDRSIGGRIAIAALASLAARRRTASPKLLGAAGQPGQRVQVVHHERSQPMVEADGQRLVVEVLGRARVVAATNSAGVRGHRQRGGDVQVVGQCQRPVDQPLRLVPRAKMARAATSPGSERATMRLSGGTGSAVRTSRSNQGTAPSGSPLHRCSMPRTEPILGMNTAWSAPSTERTTGSISRRAPSMSPATPMTKAKVTSTGRPRSSRPVAGPPPGPGYRGDPPGRCPPCSRRCRPGS